MMVTVNVPERIKPMRVCCGCGNPVISWSDNTKGYGHAGDEIGYKCCLCRKIVCGGCDRRADFIKAHNEFADEYERYFIPHYGKHVCRRCVGKFEMRLIKKLDYTELPLHVDACWLTDVAVQYFRGRLQGKYT